MTHKLLLADDSVTIQRVIELTFADEDIEVTAVGDGQLAIERLDIDPPDIVLADVDMPKRDGYEVAAYVRSRPKLAHIPVVLLTGAFEPIDHARAVAAGSTDVFAKPFEPQMVINRVKELLGKKHQHEPEQYEIPSQQTFAPAQPSPAGEGGQPVSLDDYFDQLDAAFSNLQPGATPATEAAAEIEWATGAPSTSAPEKPAPPSPAAAPARPVAAAPPPEPPITPPAEPHPATVKAWAAPPLVPPPQPAPPAPTPPVAAQSPAPVAPAAPAPPVAPVAPFASTPPRATNPFANLSAAKAEAAARPAAPVITEDVIEEVVARVLQRLSDKVVRETVTDIVAKTAERLVQEEIGRIKETGQ
jgi:CheY-like chemotaxis protein